MTGKKKILLIVIILLLGVAFIGIGFVLTQSTTSTTKTSAKTEEGTEQEKKTGMVGDKVAAEKLIDQTVTRAIPETFISIFAGSLIDNHPGITGYRYFFIFLTIVIAIGLVLILIWKAYLKHAKIDKSKMDEKAMEELKQYV